MSEREEEEREKAGAGVRGIRSEWSENERSENPRRRT